MGIYAVDNYSDVPYDIDFGILDSFIHFLSNFGSMAFGILALLITIYMAFITAFDIFYLNFPAVQLLAGKYNLDGSLDTSKLKIRIISRDAYKSVIEKESSGDYGNVNLIYLGKRGTTYIRFAIVVTFLIAGPRLLIPLTTALLKPAFEAFGILK